MPDRAESHEQQELARITNHSHFAVGPIKLSSTGAGPVLRGGGRGQLTVGAAGVVAELAWAEGVRLHPEDLQQLAAIVVQALNTQLDATTPAPAVGPLSRFEQANRSVIALIVAAAAVLALLRDTVEWIADDNPPPPPQVNVTVEAPPPAPPLDPVPLDKLIDTRVDGTIDKKLRQRGIELDNDQSRRGSGTSPGTR